MNTLHEHFDETAAVPAPPSRLTALEVYDAAWRRRRTRTALSLAAGFAAVAVVVVGVVATVAPRHQAAVVPGKVPSSAPASPVPTAVANGGDEGFGQDGVVLASAAADAGHLYAVQLDCHTSATCDAVLVGSDDGGQTWTARSQHFSQYLDFPAPGVLHTLHPGDPLIGKQPTESISTDGGRTWKGLAPVNSGSAARVQAVPAGGWAIVVGDLSHTVYAVDPHTGRSTRLATQPAMNVYSVQPGPASAGIWVDGRASQGRHAAIGVSRDNGRTWTVHEFGPGEAGYPDDANDEEVAAASLDGTSGYAVVSIAAKNEADSRYITYHTADGGATWQRVDPRGSLPYAYGSRFTYLAADGTHVVERDPEDPTTWYATTDGGASYHKPPGVTGLTGYQQARDPVLYTGSGVYTTHDQVAIYWSSDGLHFSRVPVPSR